MIYFKTKILLIIKVEGKMLTWVFERIAINETRKQAEQAKTSHSLSTSENTSSSNAACLEADKACLVIERSSKSTFQQGKLRENIKSRHCFHQSEQRKRLSRRVFGNGFSKFIQKISPKNSKNLARTLVRKKIKMTDLVAWILSKAKLQSQMIFSRF